MFDGPLARGFINNDRTDENIDEEEWSRRYLVRQCLGDRIIGLHMQSSDCDLSKIPFARLTSLRYIAVDSGTNVISLAQSKAKNLELLDLNCKIRNLDPIKAQKNYARFK